MSDYFASPLISQILTWIFSIPIIFGILAFTIGMLFDKMEEMPRIYIWWVFVCMILFSPIRYIFLQIFVATAFPFQSYTGFLQSILLASYIPIVFGLLYAIGLGLPFVLVMLIVGMKDSPSKARLFLSGIVAPLIFLVFSSFYYNLLPYAAYSTHWVEPKALIRSTNGPPYYFYRYAVEQFTPLQFSCFAHDIGLENLDTKERFRAHLTAVYLGKKQHWFYVSKAHPEYFERMKKQQLKSSSDKQLWTEEEQQWFLEGCKGDGAIKGWSQKETDKFCDCFLEKLIEVIPDPMIYEGGNLPESIVREIQLKCFDIIK